MKKTTNFTQVVMVKREMLDVLQEMMEKLDSMEQETKLEWRATGEQEQRTRWNDEINDCAPVFIGEDGKQTFEDTGKPWMVDKYDNLPKKEYSDRDTAKLEAIEKVRQTLAALA